ncbi:sec-independent protein translocase protein TatB [Sphingomonas jejuensis]|uniref:Sec-independent protein translocase protein TatB n=1 Tax=Sphingomonas jejuensis TaxID=904715 RepID=A0ABX0XHH3_9SPHN|nr:Sec-independent protein translocase protein TatB [Sphingomonas jejuensis]NJC32670.1 sec-independent protein translocase protein TatB [Sphingomonas jejuensis]
MFDFAWSEMLLCAAVALIVIGPKELPQTMRTVGRWVGKARGVARHFRSGFDAMVREAELEEMEKRWRQENERIMREHPAPADGPDIPAQAADPVADTPVADGPVVDQPGAGAPVAGGVPPSAPAADGAEAPAEVQHKP